MSETLPFGIRAKTIYLAHDDSEWTNIGSAQARNDEINRLARANAMLAEGHNVLACLIAAWPWFDNSLVYRPLSEITKDTLIAISYLQCREEPRYRVHGFSLGGDIIQVWGDEGPRGWPRAYSCGIAPLDLAHYIVKTFDRYGKPDNASSTLA